MKKNSIIIASVVAIVILTVVLFVITRGPKTEKTEIKHDMVLQQVEELGRLEVLKYSISDIVEYKKIRNWLPNSKTALIVVGEVIACVDLAKITKDDIVVSGDSVSLLLPIPEICSFKVDHSRSRVYDVRYGLWDTPELVDEAYREAERQIYTQALEMGIADESRQSTIKIMKPMLSALGFRAITINFKTPEQMQGIDTDKQNINIIPPKK